jgi:hypothetical protein
MNTFARSTIDAMLKLTMPYCRCSSSSCYPFFKPDSLTLTTQLTESDACTEGNLRWQLFKEDSSRYTSRECLFILHLNMSIAERK